MRRLPVIIEELVRLPWPVSAVLATLPYPIYRILIAQLDDQTLLQSMVIGVANVWWFFSGIFLLVAFISFVNRVSTKHSFERNRTPDQVRALDWQQFESYVGEAFRRKGYVAIDTPAGPDEGVDLILRKKDGEKIYVQCKHWKTRQVEVDKIRELLSIMASSNVSKGIFVTSGEFTEQARRFARENNIRLVGGASLQWLIGEVE